MQKRLLLWWLALRRNADLRNGFRVITATAAAVEPLESFIELTRSAATRELPRQLTPEQVLSREEVDAP